MKNLITTILTTLVLSMTLSHTAYADQNKGLGSFLNNENIGRIIGTGLGAIIGAQVGKGSGNDAAIAAGAVGGYILGGKIGRDWQTRRNTYSNNTQTNPVLKPRESYLEPVSSVPPLKNIDSDYFASKNSNVRGGPGTEYVIVDGLQSGEKVRVLGQVIGQPWYLIAQNDIVKGFVHTSLIKPGNYYL